MKFYCEWKETATVIQECSGWVEAESEERAIEELKKGNVNINDCTIWDELDSTVTSIDKICVDE